jgi:hypothetical protein
MATEPMEALGLSLSPEEVFYVLDELKLPALPGIDRQAFDALGPEQQALVRETAKHSLLARDLLVQTDGGQEVNPLLLSALGPDFVAEHTVLLGRREGAQGQRLYYANSAQGVNVLRWEGQLGTYQFFLLNSKEALQKAVVDLMELDLSPSASGPAEAPAYRVGVEQFEQAQAAPAEAAAILRSAGVPEAAASAIAADLSAGKTISSITAVHHQPADAAGNLALMVIQGSSGTWLADYSQAGATGQIALRPSGATEVVDRLGEFFAAIPVAA